MNSARSTRGSLVVMAYRGDAKTLLAFDITHDIDRRRLAGFTLHVAPKGRAPYYLWNMLQFRRPADHAQDPEEPPYSTVNAPLHRFRWVHVPGSDHQGLAPPFGPYTYTVTPRWFDAKGRLLPLDPSRGASVDIVVDRFEQGRIKLGFSRGYVQSQAYVRHFGHALRLRPANAPLVFDTAQEAGRNDAGVAYTWRDAYAWAGFTARERIAGLLADVQAHPQWRLDVFAYDFDEPDIAQALLDLAREKRVRLILDNAALHTDAAKPTSEDEFARLFEAAGGAVKRGRFSRYAHHKVFVVYTDAQRRKPERVLTGSTNFSVTGLYVNANHVVVFDDPHIAVAYAQAFEFAWTTNVKGPAFAQSALAKTTFAFVKSRRPQIEITFSPHTEADAQRGLARVVSRIEREKTVAGGSVLFAVMAIAATDGRPNTVYDTLRALHKTGTLFSYGVSDSPGEVHLYGPDSTQGVLVSGKAGTPLLPAPFQQVPGVGSAHQIHHKFVVCGFGRKDATVICGSSNLAQGGERENGDNLVFLHDADVAAAFATEALLLVDHFNFLDRLAGKVSEAGGAEVAPVALVARGFTNAATVARTMGAPHAEGGVGAGGEDHGDVIAATVVEAAASTPPHAVADKRAAARAAQWFLGTDDRWAAPYFTAGTTRARDRMLFAGTLRP